MFQFPSNGKVYPKYHNTGLWHGWMPVSIPFKRESISKVYLSKTCIKRIQCFNSLQTGKYIQSILNVQPINPQEKVSIPFKRESISKADGRYEIDIKSELKFQFPSNGKVYPKSLLSALRLPRFCLAFQFPSNGKVYPKLIHGIDSEFYMGFNSLQTGKYIQRESGTNLEVWVAYSFNSLQTGKYIQSDMDLEVSLVVGLEGFNSLQTGKYIQRRTLTDQRRRHDLCFNSLQTGKYIQRRYSKVERRHSLYVSIPFKRESISKGLLLDMHRI